MQVFHEPDPLPDGLRPDLFVRPANLAWPVRRIVVFLGFDAYGNRADHLSGAHAVEWRPVITFTVNDAGRKWMASQEPLGLLLRQIFRFQIPSQLSCSR